jgi:hypothetical protein
MLPATPFTKELGAVQIGNFWVDAISHTFFVLSFLVLFYHKKLYVSKSELIVFGSILLISLVNSTIFQLPVIIVFKQFLPIFILYFVSKMIIEYKGPQYIMEKYVDYALIASIIGFAQLILKLFGIKLLTIDLQLNLDSLAFEPSHYVVMTLPALIYLYETKRFNLKFYIIFLALILTFKTTFLVSFLTYAILTNMNFKKRSIIIFLIVGTVGIMSVVFNEGMYSRYIHFINFLLDWDISELENLTIYSFMSNFHIAIANFIDTYGFGIGLGGHDTMYYRNLELFLETPYDNRFWGINSKSAHSLLIRVISELGVIGILLLSAIFIKSLQIKQANLRAIALASYASFIAKFFKTGSYFEYGTILFLVLIIVSIKLDNDNKVILNKSA